MLSSVSHRLPIRLSSKALFISSTRLTSLKPLPRRTSIARTRTMSIQTHSSLKKVSIENAPAAIGPYSQAIVAPPYVFISGCLGFDPKTAAFVPGGVEEQATQALKNLKAVVEGSGSELGKVVKVTVFMKDMNDFVAVNKIYESAFGEHKPARSAVEVARLPRDALVEIEAIAAV
ncbi:YjgF-like protein [Stereum hirsutum FP-91666 SS1]|uniref:YjgF-like protein n=1 Tax=Stereum hirsutum (strain FP-91666) TaxID=721885 RepID=UPI000444964B|nr:YjgF-like protein [Stereum hirsutum FP-91666 SS1]EIM83194.1 YjgF-like protein [Stereum hirsutum FP-91666 SS1]